MFIKCKVKDCWVDAMKYVDITDYDGVLEQVIVSTESIKDGGVEVWPVCDDPKRDAILVELPYESVRGSWRIWVPKSSVLVPA